MIDADKLRALEAENKRLREALDFYANEERWRDFSMDETAAAYDRNYGSEFGDDRGKRARQALASDKARGKAA